MFWREAWLKRVGEECGPQGEPGRGTCTAAEVEGAAVVDRARQVFRCQITQLKAFTEPLHWWDVRQYVRDVATNDVSIKRLAGAFVYATYRKLTELGLGYRFLTSLYDRVQALRGRAPFPLRSGTLEQTPTEATGLQLGDLVRVKSYPEILATLDRNNKNRGMAFDPEMVHYCGSVYRVAKRVGRILDERSGKMLEFSNPCIVLENVFCRSEKSKHRLFCPRSILHYWREIWLERVPRADAPPAVR
jgi:hypothetical protein